MKLEQRCRSIELILCDVDGVLTDGGLYFDNQGIESKKFHVRDGLGVKLWRRAGGRFAILTARSSHIVKVRAAELQVEIVRQGFEEKLAGARSILEELNIDAANACHIGDDLTDLSVMRHVGLAIAVADAAPEVRAAAHYTTQTPGGRGAVREAIEMLLKTQMRWDELVRSYTGA